MPPSKNRKHQPRGPSAPTKLFVSEKEGPYRYPLHFTTLPQCCHSDVRFDSCFPLTWAGFSGLTPREILGPPSREVAHSCAINNRRHYSIAFATNARHTLPTETAGGIFVKCRKSICNQLELRKSSPSVCSVGRTTLLLSSEGTCAFSAWHSHHTNNLH
jgi:hypothetical protein